MTSLTKDKRKKTMITLPILAYTPMPMPIFLHGSGGGEKMPPVASGFLFATLFFIFVVCFILCVGMMCDVEYDDKWFARVIGGMLLASILCLFAALVLAVIGL